MSSGANVICNSTIGGNLQVQNSASSAPWRLGGCGPNSVGGNLQFQNNAGTGNTIWRTTVKGNLQCQGNHDVTGSGNTVNGNRQGQCAGCESRELTRGEPSTRRGRRLRAGGASRLCRGSSPF